MCIVPQRMIGDTKPRDYSFPFTWQREDDDRNEMQKSEYFFPSMHASSIFICTESYDFQKDDDSDPIPVTEITTL